MKTEEGRNRSKNINMLKVFLDTGMIVILAMLFRKEALGMAFHEIAGLCVLGVFVIHVLLNHRWVIAVTCRLFSKKSTIRAKICWLIDAALAICFFLIGLSGILMSKVVFHFNVQGNWKTMHYFCAALALTLTGIHLGMHGAVIGHTLARKLKKIPAKVSAAVFVIISLVIVTFGAYSLKSSSYSRWITMPFSSQQSSGAHDSMKSNGDSDSMKNSSTPDGMKYMQNKDSGDQTDGSKTQTDDSSTADSQGNSKEQPSAEGMPENSGNDSHGRMQVNRSAGTMFLGAVQTFAQFFSIMYLFAVITILIDMIPVALQKRRSRQHS